MNQPLKINKLLGTGTLAGLLGHARDLRKMNARLTATLPAPLDAHCHILSIRNSVLVLAADSPVWAARLRFHAPQLAEQLTPQDAPKCYTIHVRVRPPETNPLPQPRRAATGRPGRQGTAALQQAAQSVSDPELKTALLRLASRDSGR